MILRHCLGQSCAEDSGDSHGKIVGEELRGLGIRVAWKTLDKCLTEVRLTSRQPPSVSPGLPLAHLVPRETSRRHAGRRVNSMAILVDFHPPTPRPSRVPLLSSQQRLATGYKEDWHFLMPQRPKLLGTGPPFPQLPAATPL